MTNKTTTKQNNYQIKRKQKHIEQNTTQNNKNNVKHIAATTKQFKPQFEQPQRRTRKTKQQIKYENNIKHKQ